MLGNYLPQLGLAVLFSLSLLVNTVEATACNATSLCPSFAPCCSEYGFCGSDDFCLGGCNPLMSFNITSCRPEPVCDNMSLTFSDKSRILTNATLYDGNATAYDWVVDKGTTILNNDTTGSSLALILTETNGGTRLSSTRYVHYGQITATLKTSRWAGVVTAFITMSDIKDEIDWEFPGAKTTQGQTNFFWEGFVPPSTNGATSSGLTDTFSNYHDYSINWQADTLQFLIDGAVVRTVNKADTMNMTTGVSLYPTSPSRIQLSIWPAGINTSAPGTVIWAGGMIDWTEPDYVSAGHFYALVKSVKVQCADAPARTANITSYIYSDNSTSLLPVVQMSNRTTLLDTATPIALAGTYIYSMITLVVLALSANVF